MYDPLLAKLTVHAETRTAAIERAIAALRRYAILGIRTNVPFLIRVLDHPSFRSGDIDTGFIERHVDALTRAPEPTPPVVAAAASATSSTARRPGVVSPSSEGEDPWASLSTWGR